MEKAVINFMKTLKIKDSDGKTLSKAADLLVLTLLGMLMIL